jgi:hypothetical protein
MARLEIIIDKKGQVKLDVSEVTGATCQEITKAFEEAIGSVEETNLKEDYYNLLDPVENLVYGN